MVRNNIPNFQRAMSMKILQENGKICNQAMVGERLKRVCELLIVDEVN